MSNNKYLLTAHFGNPWTVIFYIKSVIQRAGGDPYGKFEMKASLFRAGMKPTNSIQPPTTAQTGFQRNL